MIKRTSIPKEQTTFAIPTKKLSKKELDELAELMGHN